MPTSYYAYFSDRYIQDRVVILVDDDEEAKSFKPAKEFQSSYWDFFMARSTSSASVR
ncbi:hypothetical protein BraRD5C2_38070 [Bradyrhizobium sp. RD5-C2]|nr:hypothetical protein BraRD5C2_38070 [Bradyrhizobium sp. RD5-C2]